jgi:hypothetical protein
MTDAEKERALAETLKDMYLKLHETNVLILETMGQEHSQRFMFSVGLEAIATVYMPMLLDLPKIDQDKFFDKFKETLIRRAELDLAEMREDGTNVWEH